MPAPEAAIKAEKLRREFDGVVAVEGLDLEVAPGELFGLVGPDGAGKTTTIRLLASILLPTSGDAWVAHRHVVHEAQAVKESIGYVSQRFGLYPDLTVDENMAFYADIYGVTGAPRRDRITELLGFSGLEPFRKRWAGRLSGGMKQKLGLACALVHTPKVLLLDEPTNGVDPVSRREFWRILNRLLLEKVTIFVSTSYLDEARKCNRVALMSKGTLLACAAPDDLAGRMTGAVVEIRTRDPRTAAKALREGGAGGTVDIFGANVRVAGDDAGKILDRSKKILEAAGIEAADIYEIGPSLEDVFVWMLGEKKNG